MAVCAVSVAAALHLRREMMGGPRCAPWGPTCLQDLGLWVWEGNESCLAKGEQREVGWGTQECPLL